MTVTEYVQGSDIAARVAQRMGDLQFRHVSRPTMMRFVRKGLAQMAMMGSSDIRSYETQIPESLRIRLPEGIVNIRHIYLFNGENCDYNESHVVHHKINFKHKGGTGFLADQKGENHDYIIRDTWWGESAPSDLYYGNIQAGYLMLSSNCSPFPRIHIEYEGTGQTDDDCKVPIFAEQAMEDYVHHEAAQQREFENPAYWRGVIDRKQAEMRDSTGSWITARTRFAMMDKFARKDLYFALTKFPP